MGCMVETGRQNDKKSSQLMECELYPVEMGFPAGINLQLNIVFGRFREQIQGKNSLENNCACSGNPLSEMPLNPTSPTFLP